MNSRETQLTPRMSADCNSIMTLRSDFGPSHTRNRITKTLTDVDGNLTTIEDQVVTYYSYDPHGNVEWLVQSLPDGSTQRQNFLVEYDYDLISGKVTEVRFQPNREDQFTHRYTYDRDNRLSAVHTSHDGVLWERDAEYEYYPHGPLRRISMGRDSVQGIDYTYTINGWLKGINLPTLDENNEPGRDNDDNGPNTHHGRDAFGMMLNYHIGDFHKPERTGTGAHPESPFHFAAQPTNMTLQSLYNGNIAGWMWNSRDNTGAMQTRLGSVYRYDQLNRLRVDSVHTWNGTNAWVPGSKWLNYYSYDADGNIKTLYRNDDGGNGLDNLQYHYITGKPNQLRRVQEHMAATAYTGDLEDQAETNNYAYDATGNLTQDVSENIQTGGISWTPYNKIDRIVKVTGGTPTMKLAYLYDASGNRVIKDHYATDTSSSPTRTYYVRDAQGNVMGIFKRASGETYAERQETPIYGSSRLGVSYKGALHTAVATDTLAHYNTLYTRELRQRGYELTDHLGNVRATVSDMLMPRGSGVFDADLRTLTDYYPFGMTMPGRTLSPEDYRYGYNTQERVDEIAGEGNHYTAEFWEYDPRAARRWNLDPRPVVGLSDYHGFANNPIFLSDHRGDSAVDMNSDQPGEVPTDKYNSKHLTRQLNSYIGVWGDPSSRKYAPKVATYLRDVRVPVALREDMWPANGSTNAGNPYARINLAANLYFDGTTVHASGELSYLESTFFHELVHKMSPDNDEFQARAAVFAAGYSTRDDVIRHFTSTGVSSSGRPYFEYIQSGMPSSFQKYFRYTFDDRGNVTKVTITNKKRLLRDFYNYGSKIIGTK